MSVERTIQNGTATDYSLSAACSIQINTENWPTDMEFKPVVPYRDGVHGVYSTGEDGKRDVRLDFPPVPGGTNDYQVSAAQLPNTSTIFFMPGVSSVVFDLSAKAIDYDGDLYNDIAVGITIDNPSINARINKADETSSQAYKRVLLEQQYKPINLFLSGEDATGTAVSANYRVDESTTNNLLSCVNLWDFLYPSVLTTNTNAFSTVSGTHPISASFTINDSVSIISTDNTLPALYSPLG